MKVDLTPIDLLVPGLLEKNSAPVFMADVEEINESVVKLRLNKHITAELEFIGLAAAKPGSIVTLDSGGNLLMVEIVCPD